MYRKYTNRDDVAYSEDTRKTIMKLYEEEIAKAAQAADMVMDDLLEHDKMTRRELRIATTSIVAGIFIVGFKAGNDFFMDEAEKNK